MSIFKWGRSGSGGLAFGFFALAAALVYTGAPHATADADVLYNPSTWNNKKIYLSAAWHTADTGARGECSPGGTARAERTMARNVGDQIADYNNNTLGWYGLIQRGYKVRLGRGTPTENASRSNTWAASAHIPLHSNAGTASGTCASRTGSSRGTWEIYRAGEGTGLPNAIRSAVGPQSPGTNDQTCTITGCTSFSCLEELCAIDAPHASYSETEFHDWNAGITFLTTDRATWTWRFAGGIDSFFGYPR